MSTRRRRRRRHVWIHEMIVRVSLLGIVMFHCLLGIFHSSLLEQVDALSHNTINIKVCQNKHCCKRTPKHVDVLQTMSNLWHNNNNNNNNHVVVEGSSCLSHCDMGPNVEITLPDGTTRHLLHGMTDAQTCAVQLSLLATNDEKDDNTGSNSLWTPPKILLAASKVIEQSQALSSVEEQIRFLTSVIAKLEASEDYQFTFTAANAHAHALRAKAYLEQGVSLDLAMQDAQYVVRDLRDVATPNTLASAFRTWVDAEQHRNNFRQAVTVLQEWYKLQPTFRTKLQREIQELMQKS
jgi:(2Fe-2S) ferredoxin